MKLKNGKTLLLDPDVEMFLSRYPVGMSGPYARVHIDGRDISIHRLVANPNRSQCVDHINGDGLDCRRENLRCCSSAENSRNGAKKGKTSKYKGVYWDKSRQKWHAQITHNRINISIGRFDSEEDAARAYDKEATNLHGVFARTNYKGAA